MGELATVWLLARSNVLCPSSPPLPPVKLPPDDAILKEESSKFLELAMKRLEDQTLLNPKS